MASKARKAFDSNVKDVRRLLEIHADVGGDEKGRRFGLEVLNKSAVVLITAVWEAYCEDLASEALQHLINNVASASNLPTELKKSIAREIKSEANDLAMWSLADTGWQGLTLSRLKSLTEARNRKLNTPKSDQIDQLFKEAVGLINVSSGWYWKSMSVAQARAKLDKYVTLRGAIAHRGSTASSVTKSQVTDYLQHVTSLVGKTGGRVNKHLKDATGKPLW